LKYHDNVSELEFPETGLNSIDYNKRLRFEQLKSTRIESLCKWKQNDVKGIKKNAYIKEIQKKNESILTVTDKSGLEKLEVYTDRFPLLHFRKQVRKLMIFIHLFSKFVIETKLFDNISINVIVANSLVMMFEGS
jgi:methyltransferase-like protein